MSEKTESTLVNQASTVPPSRWLGNKTVLRRVLLALLWCATLVALFYGFENWRGRRAWENYRQPLLARGERLDLPAIIPPAVPDEQNFAQTPFLKAWFERRQPSDTHWGDNFTVLQGKVPSPSKDRARRRFVDLGAWQKAFAGEFEENGKLTPTDLQGEARAKAAQAILEELKEIEPILTELREASQRPFSRYPVHYDLENPWGILLPHLANVRSTCERIQLKACAELAAGHTDRAFADVKLLFRLVDSLDGEPFLIAYLVKVAALQIAIQPVWEGIVEHRWTDAQLRQMQEWFGKCDFKADAKKPLDCERAAAIWTVEVLRRKGNLAELLNLDANSSTFEVATHGLIGKALTLMPKGWAYQEQLNYCRFFDQLFEKHLLSSDRRVVPSAVENTAAQIDKELQKGSTLNKLLRHRLAASLLLPALGNMGYRVANGQVAADQAAIACAIERFRLAHGRLPQALAELTPKLMPHVPQDFLSGQPYSYNPDGETGYLLYSVGWNEQDDGGTPGRTLFDKKAGDWMWEIPEKGNTP